MTLGSMNMPVETEMHQPSLFKMLAQDLQNWCSGEHWWKKFSVTGKCKPQKHGCKYRRCSLTCALGSAVTSLLAIPASSVAYPLTGWLCGSLFVRTLQKPQMKLLARGWDFPDTHSWTLGIEQDPKSHEIDPVICPVDEMLWTQMLLFAGGNFLWGWKGKKLSFLYKKYIEITCSL